MQHLSRMRAQYGPREEQRDAQGALQIGDLHRPSRLIPPDGVYRKRRTDLLPVLRQPERAILETARTLDGSHDGAQVNFDELSGDLLCWASDIIEEYSPDESETPMDGGGDNG